VIPSCSLNGVTLTIRKFNSRHFSVKDLVEVGTLERWLANQLEDYVLARKNVLISGGTGTGKTTLLNVLGKFIPEDERILLIEDTSEIQIEHQNLVRLEARQPQYGLPAVTIRDLLKAALRHRPDRMILGEIRGERHYDLLQLLNTGHSGSLSTVHATSAKQALARFTSCVLQSGVDLPYRGIKTNIGHSVNVVVQLERRPGRRFVSEVVQINAFDADTDEYDLSTRSSSPRAKRLRFSNPYPPRSISCWYSPARLPRCAHPRYWRCGGEMFCGEKGGFGSPSGGQREKTEKPRRMHQTATFHCIPFSPGIFARGNT
jgi:Flp pilus assembly CpaF family ATPase